MPRKFTPSVAHPGKSPSMPDAFNCPHCGAYAHQYRGTTYWLEKTDDEPKPGPTTIPNASDMTQLRQFQLRKCESCKQFSIWMGENLVYPKQASGPKPHEDMPEDVERDFSEARLIVDDSPRAAAALLRLAIQRMVNDHLEAEGSTLYEKIGDLVERGRISIRIQRALDSVRVIGNESVHPGEMEMDDDRETANALFGLLNAIVDETVGRDQMIDEIFESLPEGAKDGIEQRDEE